jgi:hypothetical protein
MFTLTASTLLLLLLTSVYRKHRLFPSIPIRSANASKFRAVRTIRVTFDDGLNRDVMRWENEGGRWR